MRIKVDYTLCCGSSICASIAPRYFEMDAKGKLQFKEVVGADDVAEVNEAINCCPTEAISLAD
ncbi:MAG: ferredoxin [Actinomycetota bacterium]